MSKVIVVSDACTPGVEVLLTSSNPRYSNA